MPKLLLRQHGEPIRYGPHVANAAFNLRLLGATNEEICDTLGISVPTYIKWRRTYKELAEAHHNGGEAADAAVTRSMFQKAMGYEHKEEKVFCNSKGVVTRVNTTKKYPPDVVAAIFWLKNRQPDKWRDRKEIEHGGNVGIRQVLESIWQDAEEEGLLIEHEGGGPSAQGLKGGGHAPEDGSDLV